MPKRNPKDVAFALRLALACLERVNAAYGRDLQVIDPDDEDDTMSLDNWIAEWGVQGAINDGRDALAGRPLER